MAQRKAVTAERAENGWSKQHIQFLLAGSDKAVGRALLQIYARQTQDEKRAGDTCENNSMGFSGIDGKFLSNIAEKYKKYNTMTPNQMAFVRPKMMKYWKQLLEIAATSPVGPNFELPPAQPKVTVKKSASRGNAMYGNQTSLTM